MLWIFHTSSAMTLKTKTDSSSTRIKDNSEFAVKCVLIPRLTWLLVYKITFQSVLTWPCSDRLWIIFNFKIKCFFQIFFISHGFIYLLTVDECCWIQCIIYFQSFLMGLQSSLACLTRLVSYSLFKQVFFNAIAQIQASWV